MVEIIEDELSRTKESQAYHAGQAKALEAFGAPLSVIEYEKRLSKMSHSQVQFEKQKEREFDEKKKQDYAAENPMREEVVETIFKWFDEHGDSLTRLELDSTIRFNMKMNPLTFMTEEEFDMDLYNPLTDGLRQQLWEKNFDEQI